MATYLYECQACRERFEVRQGMNEQPLTAHADVPPSECDGVVQRILSPPALQFKGSGWYCTDPKYKSK